MTTKSMDTQEKATNLGNILYDAYVKEKSPGMGDLIVDWAKEHFYGRLVEDHLPMFRELWKKLNDNDHTSYDTALSYGDADVFVWAEQLDENTKLIIADHKCRCVDDNITIFKLKEYPDVINDGTLSDDDMERTKQLNEILMSFLITTAYEKEKKSKFVYADHRGIENPSLKTYRKCNFEYGYGDGRDKTHVLNFGYSHKGPNVEKAHWTEGRIRTALDDLHYYNDMYDEEEEHA